MIKKIGFAGVGLALLISPLFASAQTLSELRSQLEAALVQLQLATGHGAVLGASTDDTPDNPNPTSIYCPQLSQTLKRGMRDTQTVPPGQVSELQTFITDYYNLDENIVVGGYFGKLTQRYVIQFQQEQGLPAYGIVGSLTRAKIASVCGNSTAGFKILAPNGGESWQETPSVTDTISGYERYKQDIKWAGAPDGSGFDGRVVAYLEKYQGGQYITVGKIPPFAYGSIMWVVGLVNTDLNCSVTGTLSCYQNMTIVPPGLYYVRLVDTQTGSTDRSDAPFTISTTSTTPTGTLTVSTDASSPPYKIVAGGTTGVTLAVYKFHATGESIALNRVGLHLTSGKPQDLTSIYLSSGGTILATGVLNAADSVVALTSPWTIPKDTDGQITVKGDIANIGLTQPATSGDLIIVDASASTQGTGLSSGSTINASGYSANIAGVRIFKSYPTVALDTLPSTGLNDGRLMRFKVTALPAGPVGLGKFSFNHSNNVSITNIGLYGYTDSSYSSPVVGQGAGGQIGSTITGSPVIPMIFPPGTPIEIPAGATYYFELRGLVSGATAQSSAVTTLLNDAQNQAQLQSGIVLQQKDVYFVWSPNDFSTSALSDPDWTNGYNVPGLPASGLIQARSGGTSNVTFNATPTSGVAPLQVQFSTNQKHGTIIFGDGAKSSCPSDDASCDLSIGVGKQYVAGTYTAQLTTACPISQPQCSTTVLATITITVTPQAVQRPTVSMLINGQAVTTIAPGAQFSVDWSSSNATSCTITNAQGQTGSTPPNVAGSSLGAAPAAGTIYTYMITCTNSAGSASQSASLVSGTGGTVGLTANGQLHLVYTGENYTLAYTSSNVQDGSCTMSYTRADGGANGSFPVPSNVYQTGQSGLIGSYTLTCKKMDGSNVSATATITAQ